MTNPAAPPTDALGGDVPPAASAVATAAVAAIAATALDAPGALGAPGNSYTSSTAGASVVGAGRGATAAKGAATGDSFAPEGISHSGANVPPSAMQEDAAVRSDPLAANDVPSVAAPMPPPVKPLWWPKSLVAQANQQSAPAAPKKKKKRPPTGSTGIHVRSPRLDYPDDPEDDFHSFVPNSDGTRLAEIAKLMVFNFSSGCVCSPVQIDELPAKLRETIANQSSSLGKLSPERFACLRVMQTDGQIIERRKQWYTERGVSDVSEAIGFHGTSPTAARGILQTGFRPVGTVNGASYGHGIYLATPEKMSLALRPEYAREENGIRTVLVCRYIQGAARSRQIRPHDRSSHISDWRLYVDGIRVVWWPNASSDIVVTHILVFAGMKNRIKKKLIALGYRMGQPLLIAAANLSRRGAKYNSSVGAQIVLTATIERIRSNGCVRLSLTDGSKEDISDVNELTQRTRKARKLLTRIDETELNYPGLRCLSRLAAGELVVRWPGHTAILQLQVTRIDFEKKTVTIRHTSSSLGEKAETGNSSSECHDLASLFAVPVSSPLLHMPPVSPPSSPRRGKSRCPGAPGPLRSPKGAPKLSAPQVMKTGHLNRTHLHLGNSSSNSTS